jgi:anti-sigma factor RsiW
MRHWRAARLLTRLLDGELDDPARRRALQAHARACPRCRRRLREHEAVETLVRLLPLSLVPYQPSRAAQVRLWGLARWREDPTVVWRTRLGLGVVGLGVAAFGVAASVSVSTRSWPPVGVQPLVIAAVVAPDAATMLPVGWR